jgi:hypothetical protein
MLYRNMKKPFALASGQAGARVSGFYMIKVFWKRKSAYPFLLTSDNCRRQAGQPAACFSLLETESHY